MQQSDSLPLKGRVALVTGASRGIGAAIALRLVRAGACVAINYVSDDERAKAVWRNALWTIVRRPVV